MRWDLYRHRCICLDNSFKAKQPSSCWERESSQNLSISTAAQLVDEVVDLAPTGIQGYTLKEFSSEYAGVEQRWFLIESELSTNPSRVSNVAFAFSKTHCFLLQAFFSNHPNALLRLA
jgi:hypothetical protein